MTLDQINARIKKTDPLVTLYKGEGYLYYAFDNVAEGSRATDPNPEFVEGTEVIWETESVMVPYIKHQTADRWIEDGIAFGRKMREKYL